MYPEILLLSIAIFANISLGLVVFYRTYKRLAGWFFGLTMLFVAVWAIGDVMILLASHARTLQVAELLFYIGPMLIPVSVWFFGLTYPKRTLPWKAVAAGLLPLVIGALSIALNPARIVQYIDTSGRLNVPHPQLPGFYLYAAYFSVIFTCSYVALFFAYRREHDALARVQLRYTFYGVIFASIPALLSNLSLPIYGIGQFIWLGPLFTTIFVTIIAISIVQHRMFDIQLVIARSLGYLFSLVTVSAIYGFITYAVAGALFHLNIPAGTQVFLAAATGIAALAFNTVKRKFNRLTSKFFYRDAYDAQDLFDELNRVFVSTLNIDKLLHETAAIIQERLKSQYCLVGLKEVIGRPQRIIGTDHPDFELADIMALRRLTVKYHQSLLVTDYLEDKKHAELRQLLQRYNVAVLVRLAPNVMRSDEGLGYLVLGPKKSGNPYTRQDFRALDTIGNALLIAVQNALHFEQIQNFNQTLQEKVQQATRELRRSNVRLHELDDTKDDFISMASHQLRTPLTSVKGYLSMVLEGDAGKINATQKKMLSQAFTSSQRMVYLIADLLNVSRLKTGKFVIETVPTNLAEIISDEIAQLHDQAASRSVTLQYAKPASFPELLLDETKTRQVIMNFIDNAIYYTPAGGTIKVELLDKPGTVELRVVDNGIGVPKAEQHHLFTKFYRAGNARKARPDGTGLGLFMAKKVIAAQGGSIIFESQEGKGSTFGFVFSKSKLAPGPATTKA